MSIKMRWKLEQILKKGGGGILLEDDALIAINKPAGLLVLPDRYNTKLHNLYNLLKDTFGSIYIVHRIDKYTSGVVLFAKSPETHAVLNTAFEGKQVEKKYYTIVMGVPATETGSIDLPIIENSYGDRRMRVDEKKGKESHTDFRIIERFENYTSVEARPHTGRMHQIRIHFSAIGLPILADPIYGSGQGFFLSSIKKKYREKGEEKPLISRTALHACSLSLQHPVTGDKIELKVSLPKDMEAVIKALRKYGMRV
jgi:23S rRNA pseudouridine1911/1915/1917 synthase